MAGVPDGTGLLLISDDDGVYEYNLVTGNNSFGFGLTDQVVAEFNVSPDPEDIKATGARSATTSSPETAATRTTRRPSPPTS